MIFFCDLKFMLDAKGTTEVIKPIACLNICRNYFKHMKKKMLSCKRPVGFKVAALHFRKNEAVSQITE